jgi:hypothetical protein
MKKKEMTGDPGDKIFFYQIEAKSIALFLFYVYLTKLKINNIIGVLKNWE